MYHNHLRVFWVPIVLLILVAGSSEAAGRVQESTGTQQQELTVDLSGTTELSEGIAESNFNPGRLLVKMLFGLVAVLTLVFLVGKILSNHLGLPTGSAHYLAVLDTLPLGTGKGLVIVQAGKKHYLLGVGGERINMLTELDAKDLVDPSLGTTDFATYLNQTQKMNRSSWQQTADLIRHQVMRLRRGGHKGEDE